MLTMGWRTYLPEVTSGAREGSGGFRDIPTGARGLPQSSGPWGMFSFKVEINSGSSTIKPQKPDAADSDHGDVTSPKWRKIRTKSVSQSMRSS